MQLHFWHKIRHVWPIAIITLVEIVLAASNYTTGTFLMGWDNVMPEFHFRQALETNIFGVWQTHRGVGLPDGMGHAANLVHTLFLWLLSFALSQNMLRYAFHFLMHLTGGLGMYLLLSHILDFSMLEHRNIKKVIPMLGALFYQYNLITIQMFYTPLEAFSVHFAALPWLTYSLLRYLQQPSRNSLLLFTTVSFISTPQFFIPTLLLPTTLLLGMISIGKNIRRVAIAAATFLCINAFWLTPYLYNLPHNAPIIANAKINQMSSDEVYERNKAFGDLKNVLTMRGFMLDFEDVDTKGRPIFVMEAWRNWVNHPLMITIGYLFAGIIIVGILQSTWAGAIWLISFVFLANSTAGISSLMSYLRDHIPFFSEAYRFPFTKFSLLFGFASTILSICGLNNLVLSLQKISKLSFEIKSVGMYVILSAIIFQSFPAFTGHFFYNALRVQLPKDYIALFDFMDKMDHNGRTAYFPQPSYWSWKHYRFGYVGSGFVWYGLSQPLMDRAFDPWSNVNENYYWELSQAIYSKNQRALSAVLQKYDIRYIILDTNVSNPGSSRALFSEDTKALLTTIPEVRLTKIAGNLWIYEFGDAQTTSRVKIEASLPSVSPSYSWTDNDVAYQHIGNYISTHGSRPASPNQGEIGVRDDTYEYSYRSLFTKRAVTERNFTLPEKGTEVFNTDSQPVLLTQNFKACALLKQGHSDAENLAPFGLRMTNTNQRGCLSFSMPELLHAQGYLVSVTSAHTLGRPLLFSLINNTAKHVEVEALLPTSTDTKTTYFILPPLAPDGLGYTVYVSNDSVGTPTINDLVNITVYTLPYEDMASRYIEQITKNQETKTLIYSQAYHKDWLAFDRASGTFLTDHVLVNNWANGWELPERANGTDIVIFFWPQLLEWLGFLLIPLLLLFITRSRPTAN